MINTIGYFTFGNPDPAFVSTQKAIRGILWGRNNIPFKNWLKDLLLGHENASIRQLPRGNNWTFTWSWMSNTAILSFETLMLLRYVSTRQAIRRGMWGRHNIPQLQVGRGTKTWIRKCDDQKPRIRACPYFRLWMTNTFNSYLAIPIRLWSRQYTLWKMWCGNNTKWDMSTETRASRQQNWDFSFLYPNEDVHRDEKINEIQKKATRFCATFENKLRRKTDDDTRTSSVVKNGCHTGTDHSRTENAQIIRKNFLVLEMWRQKAWRLFFPFFGLSLRIFEH